MNVTDLIGRGLIVAALICLHLLIFQQHIVPHFGECYIDKENYKHCTLFGVEVISKELVQ